MTHCGGLYAKEDGGSGAANRDGGRGLHRVDSHLGSMRLRLLGAPGLVSHSSDGDGGSFPECRLDSAGRVCLVDSSVSEK